jgi:hypothetical protein
VPSTDHTATAEQNPPQIQRLPSSSLLKCRSGSGAWLDLRPSTAMARSGFAISPYDRPKRSPDGPNPVHPAPWCRTVDNTLIIYKNPSDCDFVHLSTAFEGSGPSRIGSPLRPPSSPNGAPQTAGRRRRTVKAPLAIVILVYLPKFARRVTAFTSVVVKHAAASSRSRAECARLTCYPTPHVGDPARECRPSRRCACISIALRLMHCADATTQDSELHS